MSKQKIVYQIHMKHDKQRSNAMKIAAVAHGVSSVEIGGGERDEVVVTGVGVDSVALALQLRRKLGFATIVSLAEVKEDKKKMDTVVIQHNCSGYNCHCTMCPRY